MYADFECNLRNVEYYEDSYIKKYQDHFPCSFAYKIVCIDDGFTKQIVVYRGLSMQFMNLLKQFLRSINVVEK